MTKPESLTQQASRGAFWALASNITVSAILAEAALRRALQGRK